MSVYPSAFGPSPQFESTAGSPSVGDKLFFYVNGSNTKQNTFTNSTGGVGNPNPIILNTLGMPPNEIWWTAGQLYKVVWAPSTDTDPPSSPIRTWDNLSGIGDIGVITLSEWILYGQVATYISATSFSVVGDQTSIFQIGRRLQTTNSGGTVYSTITNSVFGATTVVTVTNDTGVIDSGLSAVYYGVLSVNNPSVPATYAKLVSPVFTGDPKSTTPLPGDNDTSIATTAFVNAAIIAALSPNSRQTILSGPVDTNGYSSFGLATGGTSVTAVGTLKATCYAGGDANYTGTIANPSWTGLNGNTITYYRYLEITNAGVVTTGISTLAWAIQWGGTPSVTNGQHTVNVQEGKVYCGNGSTAPQVYRVLAGESVTNGSSVVATNIDYALIGQYISAWTAFPANNTNTNFNHNLGAILPGRTIAKAVMKCTTGESGWAIGEIQDLLGVTVSANLCVNPISVTGRNTANYTQSSSSPVVANYTKNGTIGTQYNPTLTNWNYAVIINRGY